MKDKLLKEQKQITLNEYLLEIERIRGMQPYRIDVSNGIFNMHSFDYLPVEFSHAVCKYIHERFGNVQPHRLWIDKYTRKNSIFWGKTPAVYAHNISNKRSILKALRLRVNILLKELEEA